ncbi:protein-L-isoaspartate O-methyltransferase [Kitasatospora sp. MAP12-15]|uniref:methyltransferase domain-containing protein n=1 Tax=unclassified Kitasatospora TaxID=2633591 RepID=UPI00247555C4|nr:methyltransferase domain-containing protein [Kitasatospora sp. MAP12-44]MDH6108464.1 protein-L-isoaspartate O-methyltransferase [Kitasatospora sp. MAP12-44]
MEWHQHAAALADSVTDPDSRWRDPVARTPRHELIPRWWEREEDGWSLRVGADDPDLWASRAYGNVSVITSVGGQHADLAKPGDRPTGGITSSATLTGLSVKMLRHARINAEHDLLDVGTGAGGLTAIAAHRLGDRRVTSVDVDAYLSEAAQSRTAAMGLRSNFLTLDVTKEPIPGSYDRIVSTVALRPVPVPLLTALRPGGRIVTTIAGTTLILTAWKTADGGAVGHIERDWAGFMVTRSGPDYPPGIPFDTAREGEGEEVTTGRYPVSDIREAWEVWSFLTISVPGVEIDFEERAGRRTAYLVHPDGSWARATAERYEPPTVHQSGPRRLWTDVERIRTRMLVEGGLPLYGSEARVTPEGEIRLSRGGWSTAIS